jgi:hypothetical protein
VMVITAHEEGNDHRLAEIAAAALGAPTQGSSARTEPRKSE